MQIKKKNKKAVYYFTCLTFILLIFCWGSFKFTLQALPYCLILIPLANLKFSSYINTITIIEGKLIFKFPTRFFFNKSYVFVLKDIESFHYMENNGSYLQICFNNRKKTISISLDDLHKFADYMKQYDIPTYLHFGDSEKLL